MVGTDGGRAYETHTAALEQAGIAARAGAHQQRVGIAHRCRGDVAGVEILDSGHGLEQPLDVGDVAFYYNPYHGYEMMWATYMAQAPAMSSSTGIYRRVNVLLIVKAWATWMARHQLSSGT